MPGNIILYPNPSLRKKSDSLDKLTKKDLKLIQTMKTIILSPPFEKGIQAAGISAPQLGTNRKIIVINHLETPLVLINPQLVKHSKEKAVDFEGCLCLPDKFGLVERFLKIKIKFQDENFKQRQFNCANFLARVIQHEIDHLDGILFIDKIIGDMKTLKKHKNN